MKRLLIVPLCLCLVFLFSACDEETRTAFQELQSAVQNSEQLTTGLQEMTRTIEEMDSTDREPVETVDFRELQSLLPETLPGMERVDLEGARQTMGGISVANAKATFQSENRGRLTVEVTDMGGVGGLAALGMGMLMMEVDRESMQGYERTRDYQGHRMHEKWDGQRERGEVTVLVERRFAVKAEGRNVPMETILASIEGINLRALEGMK